MMLVLRGLSSSRKRSASATADDAGSKGTRKSSRLTGEATTGHQEAIKGGRGKARGRGRARAVKKRVSKDNDSESED